MDKLIREQLNKCRVAKIPIVPDDYEGSIIIKKQDENSIQLSINSSYFIEMSDDYIGSEEYKNVTKTWNKDKNLLHKYLKILVTGFLSDKVKVDGIGCKTVSAEDASFAYLEYWIPTKYIRIIEVLS